MNRSPLWHFAFLLALLAFAGCDDGDDHADDPVASTGGGGGGTGGGGGGTGGGGGGGGGSNLSAPDFWDPGAPDSTTYTAPSVPSGQTYWRLVSMTYYPSGSGSAVGGDHHILFQAKDLNGAYLEGQEGTATIEGVGTETALTKGGAPYDDWKGNIPMWATGWCSQGPIDSAPGPYSFKMTDDGLPSVEVAGMGLYCNQHLTWFLVYQKAIAP